MAYYRRLFPYLYQDSRLFWTVLFAMVLTSLVEPAITVLMKPLIDQGFVAYDAKTIVWVSIALVMLGVIQAVANFVFERGSAKLSGFMVTSLRKNLFERSLFLPLNTLQKEHSGRTVSRVSSDTQMVSEAGLQVITVLIRDTLMVIAFIFVLVLIDPWLSTICLVVFPLIAYVVRKVSIKIRRLSSQWQENMGSMTQILKESMDCLTAIRLDGAEKREIEHFSKAADDLLNNQVRQVSANALSSGISVILLAVSLSGVIYFASIRANHQVLSAGDFVSFVSALLMLSAPIKRLTGVQRNVQRGLAAAESIFLFLDQTEEVDTGPITEPILQANIAFDLVSFSYPKQDYPAIQDVSFSLPSGKVYVLVGTSGGGKSTIVRLLPRLYDCDQGCITINDVDIRQYRLSTLREAIAWVGQDVMLFNRSVLDNIRYAKPEATEDQVVLAAKRAHAWDFISSLPDGLHSKIGEGGGRLSGGQRQRIAIARAFLKDAPILVLDEATSALDSASEKAIQHSLQELTRARTTLIVAHRLHTIQSVDQILVLEQGQVVERGTHQELLLKQGYYSTLWRSQEQLDKSHLQSL